MSTLEVEVKRVIRLNGNGPTQAFCDVAIDGSFLIKGVKVVNGKKGQFVSLPREQGKNGQWYDTVVPLTKEARVKLAQVVLDAYSSPNEMLQ